MICFLDHVALNVRDVEKILRFYLNVLELEPDRVEEWRKGEVPFPSVRLNPGTILDFFPEELWNENAAPGVQGSMNHFCLAMREQDWDALLVRLRTEGVALEVGPTDRWGAYGTGTSVYFKDPEGTLLEAKYYPETDEMKPCFEVC